MRSRLVRRFFAVLFVLALPAIGYAQEAALNGTVTDSTSAVLPGVTVKALHVASGNTFETVTDARGAYRIPVRVGTYKVTAELTGFKGVTQEGLEVLVGQTVTIDLKMSPGVAESVTVTGESPLIETSSSRLGTNINPRQVAELPSNGRNWMSLALLAPGNRTNAQGAL